MYLFYYLPRQMFIMCGGLNLQRHKDMTVSKFYRWLDLVDDNRNRANFELRRVRINKIDVLSYSAEPVENEPALSRSSTALLEPGDYAAYIGDEPYFIDGRRARATFAELTERYHEDLERYPEGVATKKMLLHNVLQPDIINSVSKRDNGRCCVTSATDSVNTPTCITWVLPPTWADACYPPQIVGTPSRTDSFKRMENAITLREDLLGPWSENMFSVDVDDDYRIIVFKDLPEGLTLPSHLSPDSPRPSDYFLRSNFKWCIGVHFFGGDISEDYSVGDVQTLMSELIESNNLTDEKWQSGIGAEVLEEFMKWSAEAKQGLCAGPYGTFRDDGSGSHSGASTPESGDSL